MSPWFLYQTPILRVSLNFYAVRMCDAVVIHLDTSTINYIYIDFCMPKENHDKVETRKNSFLSSFMTQVSLHLLSVCLCHSTLASHGLLSKYIYMLFHIPEIFLMLGLNLQIRHIFKN